MTIEEYIVEKLTEQEEEIKYLNDIIDEIESEIRTKNTELMFLIDLIEHVESKQDAYYGLTVWKSISNNDFEKLSKIIEKYKEK